MTTIKDLKFKVGDRVAVYFGGERWTGKVAGWHNGRADMMNVEPDKQNFHLAPVHPKQCRRLVKAKPRMRVWIGADLSFWETTELMKVMAIYKQKPPIGTFIELVEARKKP